MKTSHALWILGMLMIPFLGLGQCCSGGVPISSNLGLSSRGSGALQFQLTYDYNALRDWFDSERKREKPHHDPIRTTHSILLETNYDISNAFAVSTLFTLVRQERLTPLSQSFTRNDGLGDAIVLVKYNFFHKHSESPFTLSFGLGPKVPLGQNDFIDDHTGLLLSADLQPGTGAWEFISWTFANYQALAQIRPTFNVTSIITTRYNFPGLRNNDAQYYRFGHEINVQLGISDRFVLGKVLLDPTMMFRLRRVWQDATAIVPSDPEAPLPTLVKFPNTGGTYLYVNPSMGLNITPNLSVRVGGDFPLHRSLIGSQVATSYKIAASVYYSLSIKKKQLDILPISKF